MNKIMYMTKEESMKAYIENVNLHRRLIKDAFDKYGNQFANCLSVNTDILEIRINAHDLSKLNNDIEMEGYRLHDFLSKEDDIDSHRIKLLYEKAMLHHYHNNTDHPEHWIIVENDGIVAIDMDSESICEMVLDWIAFGNEDNTRSDAISFWDYNRGSKRLTLNTVNKIDILIDILKQTKE